MGQVLGGRESRDGHSYVLRIIKVGGSLLELGDLPIRLERWLVLQAPATNVLLAGGGALANIVRVWDERFSLDQQPSHWLCVDLLDVSAQLLVCLLPTASLISDWSQIRSATATPIVFAPAQFLRQIEPLLSGNKLPQSWQVTSDSIAARLATVTAADELVLLKSSLPSVSGDDFVDDHFALASSQVPRIRCVNLRDDGFIEQAFRTPLS